MQHQYAYSKNHLQTGLTLTEVLVTLAIMSFVMIGSGIAFQKTSPRWALDNAKTQLLVDLKRARAVSSNTEDNVILIPTDKGYQIEDLNLARTLPRHVKAIWPAYKEDEGIILNQQSTQTDIEFSLMAGDQQAVIIVERLTGRIYAKS